LRYEREAWRFDRRWQKRMRRTDTLELTMRPAVALILGGMAVAMMLVAACDAVAPVSNDPVPLSDDLAASLDSQLAPADGALPAVSPTKALEIAGKELLAELAGNNVPPQDPSVPNGLIRRVIVGLDGRPPTSVWIVVYCWAAGFNCLTEAGGPGPCNQTSVYYIDDRTGQVVYSSSIGGGPQ
jgi:hypothetical protein